MRIAIRVEEEGDRSAAIVVLVEVFDGNLLTDDELGITCLDLKINDVCPDRVAQIQILAFAVAAQVFR